MKQINAFANETKNAVPTLSIERFRAERHTAFGCRIIRSRVIRVCGGRSCANSSGKIISGQQWNAGGILRFVGVGRRVRGVKHTRRHSRVCGRRKHESAIMRPRWGSRRINEEEYWRARRWSVRLVNAKSLCRRRLRRDGPESLGNLAGEHAHNANVCDAIYQGGPCLVALHFFGLMIPFFNEYFVKTCRVENCSTFDLNCGKFADF